MSFDLHTHSTVSDGTEPPADVMARAARAGLSGIALTDHDSTAGWAEAAQAAETYGMGFIPGMEITTKTPAGISVHMLSYLHDPDDAALLQAITDARTSRMERARHICQRLAEDLPITWDDVQAQVSPGATVGRPHLADALVAVGVCRDRAEAFGSYLHPGTKYYVGTQNISPVEAIQLVRQAGGVPIIAHAMASARGRTVSHDELEDMVEAGMAGVEIYHRDNPESGRSLLRELARRHDLIITGSSDYHGEAGKPNQLGENTTDVDQLRRILQQATGFPAYNVDS